jgi:hypothetical protein
VRTFASANGVVFVGGDFNGIDGQPRSGLAALDALTGTVLPFRADVDGFVYSLLATPTRLFVAGRFDSVGGVRCRNLAVIELASHRVLSDWCPEPDESVEALALSPSALYVVGEFDRVSGRSHAGAVAIDPDDAAVLPWDPKVHCCGANDVVVDGTTVYIAGVLNGVAAFDATTGAAVWAPKLSSFANTVRVDKAGVYVGGPFATVNRVAQSGFAAFRFKPPF